MYQDGFNSLEQKLSASEYNNTMLVTENSLLKAEAACFPLAVLSFDRSGKVLHANTKALDLLGFSISEIGFDGLFIRDIFCESENPSESLSAVTEFADRSGYWRGDSVVIQRTRPAPSPGSPSSPHPQYWPRQYVPVFHSLTRDYYQMPVSGGTAPIFISVLHPKRGESRSDVSPPDSMTDGISSAPRETTQWDDTLKKMPVGMCIWQCPAPEYDQYEFVLMGINSLARDLIGVAFHSGNSLRDSIDLDSNPTIPSFFWEIIANGKTIFREQFSLGSSRFSLTAFPLPDNCVGMIFEPFAVSPDSVRSLLPFALAEVAHNAHAVVTFTNRALSHFLGFAELSLEGRNLISLVADAEIASSSGDGSRFPWLTDLIASRGNGSRNIVIAQPGVPRQELRMVLFPIPNPSGRPEQYLITFQSRAEVAMRDGSVRQVKEPAASPNNSLSPDVLQRVFKNVYGSLDNICALLWHVDRNPSNHFRLVDWNQQARVLVTQRPLEAHIPFSQIFPELVKKGFTAMLAESLNSQDDVDLGTVSLPVCISPRGSLTFPSSDSVRAVASQTKAIPLSPNLLILTFALDTSVEDNKPNSRRDSARDMYTSSPSESLFTPESLFSMLDDDHPSKGALMMDVMDVALDAIFVVSAKGDIEHCNRLFCQLINAKSAEFLIGFNLSRILDPSSNVERTCGLISSMAIGSGPTSSTVNLRFQGQSSPNPLVSVFRTVLHNDMYYVACFIRI